MGQGDETKTRPDPEVEIQEKGDIFFFYRPKVDREEAHEPDDVQRLYIVLRPQSGERAVEEKQTGGSGKEGGSKEQEGGGSRKEQEDEGGKEQEGGGGGERIVEATEERGSEGGRGSEKVNIEEETLHRFIVMGRKSLPDPSQRGAPYWGFVEMVTKDPEDLKTALRGGVRDGDSGRRRRAPARALAEGVYRILRHKRRSDAHTHLVYRLEFPPAPPAAPPPAAPQEALNVEREGSFVIQIKNPERGGADSGRFRGLQGKRRAAFPARLQGLLGGLRFAPADPPDFLNYEGCELLLISASDDIDAELGLDLKTEEGAPPCSDLIQSLGDSASVKPLLSGTWD
ncbi:unnamed protein product [Spirodela intermedia]|uniref:Uncharacterized protein n=1 Tax=Spirodela intermedia TaxID=51605 RepID=A0A7I8JN01_SPIIN|nr:unnamed protein product [Spirodela intermedia]CAA6671185.1 unnamed protein product [Spirodela intermedia]